MRRNVSLNEGDCSRSHYGLRPLRRMFDPFSSVPGAALSIASSLEQLAVGGSRGLPFAWTRLLTGAIDGLRRGARPDSLRV